MNYINKFFLCITCSFIISGCTTTARFDQNAHEQKVSQRFVELYDLDISDQEPISLENAFYLALTRNQDLKTKELEWMIAKGEALATQVDFLPQLVVELKDARRSDLLLSTSERLGQDPIDEVDTVPSFSSERDIYTTNVSLSIDILNIWDTYLRTKIKGQESLIRLLNRETVAQNLFEDVQTNYYITALKNSLGKEFSKEAAIIDKQLSRTCKYIGSNESITDNMLSRCSDGLNRQLSFANVEDKLNKGAINLAALLTLDPAIPIPTKKLNMADPGTINLSNDELYSIALSNRPDIKIETVKQNIESVETLRAWSKILPGIRLGIDYKTDDNRFLVNDDWNEKYVEVTWNILGNLVSAPLRAKVSKYRELTASQRQNALIVVTVTKVALAKEAYDQSRQKWINTHRLLVVERENNKRAQNKLRAGKIDQLSATSARGSLKVAKFKNAANFIEMQDALAKLYAAIGIPILPNIALDKIESEQVMAQLRDHLQRIGLSG